MEVDLEAARRYAESAASEVGERLREGFRNPGIIDKKSDEAADVVTVFDKEADDRLREILGKFESSFGYWGEESGQDGCTETFWLVDPIDGTGLFVRGIPMCTTMITLIHDGAPVVSVINDFNANQTYSASASGGSTCNGEAIKVSDHSLKESYMCTEVDVTKPGNAEIFARLVQATTTLATINCGWDFAMAASAHVDGRIQYQPWGHMWDYAPGALLVKEAGGVVANIGKTTYDYTDFSFIATGPRAYAELTEGPNPIFPIK